MPSNALAIDPFPDAPRTAERRLAGRALSHWDAARRGRELPSLADYAAGLPFCDSHCFVIRLGAQESEDEIVRSGAAPAHALGRDPVGARPLEILPSAIERGLRFHRTAAELRKPIADAGSFSDAEGREILYRCVLMPLSADQATVDHVIGAWSYKAIAHAPPRRVFPSR